MRRLMNNQIQIIYESIESMTQQERENRDSIPMIQLFYDILCFLAKAGRRDVIDIIFNLAKNLPEKECNNIQGNIESVLFKPENLLFKKFRKTIDEQIDQMILDEDPTINQRGLNLEKQKQHYIYNA